MEDKSKSPSPLRVLDSIRGLSAIYVLIHHARLLLTQPYYTGYLAHPEKYGFFNKLCVYGFSLFKFGHEAVLLFFVLSGFVIHLQQAKKIHDTNNNKPFNLSSYFTKRAVRIYPTLIFAFILSFSIDYLLFFLKKDLSQLSAAYTPRLFFENLFLIPESNALGFNYPLWSLKHEWFFYILYPVLYFLAKKHPFYPNILVAGLFFSYNLGLNIPYLGTTTYTVLIWWIGAILAECYVGRMKITGIGFFAILLFILSSYYLKVGVPTALYDTTLALTFAGIIWIILAPYGKGVRQLLSPIHFLGSFSYSLYLLHWPILVLIKNLYYYFEKTNELPFNYLLVFAGSLITIPVVYLFYLISEKPAIELKKKVSYRTS